ncbi:cell death abnormality protein 1 [Drosophila novamexicana]|uniref:cell death abnormality protein 1 n=1 Tax=Drosophila novamexicana TaxID=47314 RepID=UPI0011E5D527|nr:cell death abnormality protein 1 [Drosophila novamexicana]
MQFNLILLLALCLLSAYSAEDLLELGCTTNAQCEQFEGGQCHDSSCVCLARGSKERIPCQPKDNKLSNIIGGPCPCSQPHAECDTQMQQCFCADNYMASADRRRCLPLQVALNGVCEVSRQCQLADTFAVCHMSQKRCICREHFEQHQGSCRALLDLGCNNNTHCEPVGASICLPQAMKCACIRDYVPNHNMTSCVSGVGLGSNCTTPAQCQLKLGAGSTCRDNRCSCRIKHYPKIDQDPNSAVCEPQVPYGAYCRRTEDCQQHQPDVENRVHDARMHCFKGECQCRPDFRVVDNQHCVLDTSAANPRYKLLHAPLSMLIFWPIYYYV